MERAEAAGRCARCTFRQGRSNKHSPRCHGAGLALCRRRFFELYDQRAELESQILALPIGDCCDLWHNLLIIRRTVEQAPERRGELLHRLADEMVPHGTDRRLVDPSKLWVAPSWSLPDSRRREHVLTTNPANLGLVPLCRRPGSSLTH